MANLDGDHNWREGGIEPSLEEMMSDPIVRLVLRRDGLTSPAVVRFLWETRDRLIRRRRASGTRLVVQSPGGLPAEDSRAQARP
jgi:hypothetical protein